MADFWSSLFPQPSGLWMSDLISAVGQGSSAAQLLPLCPTGLFPLTFLEALRSNWAIINLGLKCQVTVKGEAAGELKGRSVICSRDPVNIPKLRCVPVPGESCTGALAWCSFQGKIAENLLAVSCSLCCGRTRIGICLGRDLELLLSRPFLRNEQVSRLQ